MKHLLFSVILTLCISGWRINNATAQDATFSLEKYSFIIDGKEMKEPFVGGFNMPQLQNINLNDDGILDIAVYDRDAGYVRTFLGGIENGAIVYHYSPRYEDIFPPIVNLMRIVDFNGDGVDDLFVGYDEIGIDAVHVYRGHRVDGKLRFTLMKFQSQPENVLAYESTSGTEIVINTSPIDIPAIDDVDYDGDMDFLTFQAGAGNAYLFRNKAVERNLGLDTIVLVFDDLCYGKFYEADNSEEISLSDSPDKCASIFFNEPPVELRHAGSTITSMDLNGDDLKDLLIGDLGSNRIVALYNGGSNDKAWMVRQDTSFPSYDVPVDLDEFLSTFKVDVNQDGKKDIVVAPNFFYNASSVNNILYYSQEINDGKIEFSFKRNDFLVKDMIDLSSHAVPTAVDVNQDGLQDIVVGTYGNFTDGVKTPALYYFQNTGSIENPEFTLVDDDFLDMRQYSEDIWSLAPTFGDLDGDGDEDLIVGDWWGRIHYYENTAGAGNPMTFGHIQKDFMDINVSYYAIPQIVDINNDGLGDLLIGEEYGNSMSGSVCGSIVYFQNLGEPGAPVFNPDETISPNTPCYGNVFTKYSTSRAYTSPQLINVDGELRLITGDFNGNVSFYAATNNPGDEFPLVHKRIARLNVGKFIHPHMVNLDADNFYELIVGTQGGGLMIYETNWDINGDIVSEESAESSSIKVYPNPTNDFIIIENLPHDSQIFFYSSTGRLMKTLKDNMTSVKCDLGSFPTGVYFILVKSYARVFTTKVIVQ